MEKQTNEKSIPSASSDLISVNGQLRQMTADYMALHPGLTLNALASRSGVPATTLRRLMQTDSMGELAPHSVLALVSYLLREKKIAKILRMIQGPVAELLNRCFDQFIFDESADHKLDQPLNELLKERTTYLVYKMAATVAGTSVDDVKDAFGLTGLKKCHELIDKQWIIVDDRGRLHAKEKNFSVDLALAHQLTHSLVDQYKPSDVERGLNLFYSLSEGMNEEGIKKIKEIEKEAVKKVFEVMNTEKFQGELAYFSLFLSDVIGATPLKENAEGALQ